MAVTTDDPLSLQYRSLRFLWLEITGRCQLACRHCYADSGPQGTHGSMTVRDWRSVIEQAADLGVPLVQFIGGEPTLHPGLPELIHHALGCGLRVEVFSNLLKVTGALWEVFQRPGVRLATSYYSLDAAQHDAVTRRRSHDRTLASIHEAVRRGIPLRVAVIHVAEGQQVEAAMAELKALGVTEVEVDHQRQVGRGAVATSSGVDQLCGHCADGSLAISPTGETWPCIFARWLRIGNALETDVSTLHRRAAAVRTDLSRAFSSASGPNQRCQPDGGCTPAPCKPLLGTQ